MLLTLTTELSSRTANSYVESDYCDEYWANHYLTAKAAQWAALTPGQKVTALVNACRILETIRFTVGVPRWDSLRYRYNPANGRVENFRKDIIPVRAEYEQSLQFPRNIDYDAEGNFFIPEPIMLAQCEQAVFVLTVDEDAISARLQGIAEESTKVGDITLSQKFTGAGSLISPAALGYLRPFVLSRTAKLWRS